MATTVTADMRDDRRRELDEFAQSAPRAQSASPSVLPLASLTERVFGAQEVAVYRDDAKVLKKIAALGAAAGNDWYYRFPVKKKSGGTDWIEGPSIKLANDVARIYGNCEIDTRVIDLGDSWLFYARFTDFETGYSLTRPFQQRKSQGSMRTDNDRALDIAFQIGASKAIRNVVANALQTYADYGFEQARNSLVEKIGKNLDGYRARTIEGIANIPVDLVRVETVLGRPAKDWTAPDVAKVIAMMKAIADGMATIDETFPAPDRHVDKSAEVAGAALDRFADDKPAATVSPQPDAGRETTAPRAADQAASETREKPAGAGTQEGPEAAEAGRQAEASKDDAPKGPPTNEREYIAYATAWIDGLTDVAEGDQRWKAEKNLRNKTNTSGASRDDLQERLNAKVAELRKQS